MSNQPGKRIVPTTSPPAPSRSLNKWLVVSAVLACLIGALAIAGFEMLRSRPADVAASSNLATRSPAEKPVKTSTATPNAAPAPAASENLVDDDGQTLWASPTSGSPLDVAYLPPGSQIILALRPAALAGHAEGVKVLAALGPLGQRAIQYIEGAMLTKFADLDRLVISCQATSAGDWLIVFVAHVKTPLSADALLTKISDATPQGDGSKKYWLADERAYYLPELREGRVLVVAPPKLIADIIELDGSAPPLRRDIEQLLAHTDADRLVTLIVAPNFLFSEGQGMFSGEMARLRGPLFWFLGDSLSAAALSMNWDENFLLELAAIPTLDVSPEQAARQLGERVRQLPELVEEYVLKLSPQTYGRRIVARFPEMVRKLAAYTRSGVEDGSAVLRCYLPDVAGHNLIMGAELTLAEAPGAGTAVASAPAASTPVAGANSSSVRDLLVQKTSLKFTRDSLEAALEQLSQDIGVEIVIVGPDLQADGITRNQQLGIEIENQSAEDILVEILRKANPDKTATGPADARQKLVYVVKPKSTGGAEAIFITTRARATERGEELPVAFRL